MSSTGDGIEERDLVRLEDIELAHKRVQAYVHRTPLLTSTLIDQIASESINSLIQNDSNLPKIQIKLAFKSEHLQKVGAFKMRGATNAIQTHLERLKKLNKDFDPSNLWVITHSSGNHAAAVACAARSVGARSAVVMPRTAPQVKKDAVKGYGAKIVECEPNQKARETTANELMKQIQQENKDFTCRFIHPYDNELVIAGQGTLALEIYQQSHSLQQGGKRGCSEANSVKGTERETANSWKERDSNKEPVLDFVVAPVGGGGMLSGVSTAIKGKDERIIVIAAEPKEADDAARSFHSNTLQPAINPPKTICDGLLTALSPFTLKHIQKNVLTILTASEKEIIHSLELIWTRMKQFIEPSAAVGLAIILNHPEFAKHVKEIALTKIKNQIVNHSDPIEIRIGVVWTGGNVELANIAKLFAN